MIKLHFLFNHVTKQPILLLQGLMKEESQIRGDSPKKINALKTTAV